MVKPKQPFNPFYAMLVVVGIIFVLTACCYGVMAFKQRDPYRVEQTAAAGQGLMHVMDKHGMTLLLAEVGVLAILTVGAIGTDQYWTRRAAAKSPAARDHTHLP